MNNTNHTVSTLRAISVISDSILKKLSCVSQNLKDDLTDQRVTDKISTILEDLQDLYTFLMLTGDDADTTEGSKKIKRRKLNLLFRSGVSPHNDENNEEDDEDDITENIVGPESMTE